MVFSFDNYKHQHSNKLNPQVKRKVRCEVCGRKIHGSPITAEIEGARLTVCMECSKHGRIVTQDEYTPKAKPLGKSSAHVPVMTQKKKPEIKVEITKEIIQDYTVKIRQAREKLGLTHEDLAKKINEKTSVIGKLETGKIQPSNILAAKLEHALKIKLLTPITEEKVAPQTLKAANRELTLGDLIQLDNKASEEQTERKPS
jgi:putative transcription factor